MLGIKPRSATYKANTLIALLLFQPVAFTFKSHMPSSSMTANVTHSSENQEPSQWSHVVPIGPGRALCTPCPQPILQQGLWGQKPPRKGKSGEALDFQSQDRKSPRELHVPSSSSLMNLIPSLNSSPRLLGSGPLTLSRPELSFSAS